MSVSKRKSATKENEPENYGLEVNELYSLLSLNKFQEPSSFEDAVKKTGFGKFNIMLMTFSICGIFAPMLETTTISYILAAAQCDLNLTLQDKGYLNSAAFGGMITSAFIWGFLLDTFGRRRLMVYGYFMDAIIVFISAFSQNFTMILLCKFLGGFVITGPFSAMTAYLSEFHSSKYRSRIQLANGTLTSVAHLFVPLLGWSILPLSIKWPIGSIELHSWNLMLFIIGLFPFISGIIFFFLPESPKYLMTIGKNDEAMKVLQRVYSWNTGNPPDLYPVQALVQELTTNIEEADDDTPLKKSKLKALNQGVQNFAPLFKRPYLGKFTLMCLIQTVFLTSLNSLRLWTPQLFQAQEDYKLYHNGTSADLCTMIEVLKPKPTTSGVCITNVNQPSVYINASIVAVLSIFAYILAGFVINSLGKKRMLLILTGISSVACISLYFADSPSYITLFTAIFISCGNVGGNIVISIVVDAFPTNLRAFSISLVMASARLGVMSGNIIFPILLQLGCAPPFAFVAGGVIAAGLLSIMAPNTENKALK